MTEQEDDVLLDEDLDEDELTEDDDASDVNAEGETSNFETEDDDVQSELSASTTSEKDKETKSYLLLFVILGGIFFSLLPLWFNAPNGYSLLKDSFSKGKTPQPTGGGVSCLPAGERLFTKEELSRYTEQPKILLGFLGVVYDVTSGSYYHPDGAYHFFAGKDGTRGFLTGEFTAAELIDDISDLDASQLNGIDTWLTLYDEKYQKVGRLVGSYYDANGCETAKLGLVNRKIKAAKQGEAEDKEEETKYPPCNSEWNATEKTGRVWCSALSGGINRSWSGRPRQLYVLASKSWRCACVREDGDLPRDEWCDKPTGSGDAGDSSVKTGVKYAPGEGANCRWKHYSDCDEQASECPFRD